MKIYLVRHGESTGDIEDRYGGDYDDHLTQRGRAQAEVLAKALADKGIETLFVSPRHRARETGEIVGRLLDLKPVFLDDLRERNAYGVVTGMVKSEARQQFPEVTTELSDPTATVAGAEPYPEFVNRVQTVLQQVVTGQEKVIAILTHGGVIKGFYRSVLKMGELAHLGDCAIVELGYKHGQWSVLKLPKN